MLLPVIVEPVVSTVVLDERQVGTENSFFRLHRILVCQSYCRGIAVTEDLLCVH